MTDLVRPDAARAAELVAMLAEYTHDTPHGSGSWNVPEWHQEHDVASARRLVTVLDHLADPGLTYLDDTVTSHYFWIVDGPVGSGEGALVGFLAFRHRLNDWLLQEGGHIGYSVRPSRRREGHASAALALAVRREASALGLERALVTCDEDNTASARTIEHCGGVLEDVRAGKRRYWVAVPAAG